MSSILWVADGNWADVEAARTVGLPASVGFDVAEKSRELWRKFDQTESLRQTAEQIIWDIVLEIQ